jgi:hypothetical protein
MVGGIIPESRAASSRKSAPVFVGLLSLASVLLGSAVSSAEWRPRPPPRAESVISVVAAPYLSTQSRKLFKLAALPDAYRTMCVAPDTSFRVILEEVRAWA